MYFVNRFFASMRVAERLSMVTEMVPTLGFVSIVVQCGFASVASGSPSVGA